MAKARKILKRVKAVKAIRTVTKTMEMVSTARFKKTHDKVVAARPYTDRLTTVVADLLRRGGSDFSHPLISAGKSAEKRDALIVLTSNRGLAGAYNSSVQRIGFDRYNQLKQAGYEVKLHVIGKRGIQYFRFRGLKAEKNIADISWDVSYEQISQMAEQLMADFIDGRISGLEVAYMEFVSTSKQKPAIAQILPLVFEKPSEPTAQEAAGPAAGTYELIPSGNDVLQTLLPATVRLRLYQCFLDASVSEQAMRIAAMRAATENADEMIHSLSVRYNRTRQAQITTELAEIMGGRQAIDNK